MTLIIIGTVILNLGLSALNMWPWCRFGEDHSFIASILTGGNAAGFSILLFAVPL